MAKLVVVTGKTGSGKSQWISKWYGENPSGRRIARTGPDLERALSAGHDVALEIAAVSPGSIRQAVNSLRETFKQYEVEEVSVA